MRSRAVGRDDPGQVVDALEIGGDARQCRGDDRLVERGEEHAEHQTGNDGQRFAARETARGGLEFRHGRQLSSNSFGRTSVRVWACLHSRNGSGDLCPAYLTPTTSRQSGPSWARASDSEPSERKWQAMPGRWADWAVSGSGASGKGSPRRARTRRRLAHQLFATLVLSRAARSPSASLRASSWAQKCMKNSRGWSSSMWLWSAVTSMPLSPGEARLSVVYRRRAA